MAYGGAWVCDRTSFPSRPVHLINRLLFSVWIFDLLNKSSVNFKMLPPWDESLFILNKMDASWNEHRKDVDVDYLMICKYCKNLKNLVIIPIHPEDHRVIILFVRFYRNFTQSFFNILRGISNKINLFVWYTGKFHEEVSFNTLLFLFQGSIVRKIFGQDG